MNVSGKPYGWPEEIPFPPDSHDIRAAVRRKKANLKQLSLAAGFSQNICCMALLRNDHPSGEDIIASFLGVKPQYLFPDRYNAEGVRIVKPTSRARRKITPVSNDLCTDVRIMDQDGQGAFGSADESGAPCRAEGDDPALSPALSPMMGAPDQPPAGALAPAGLSPSAPPPAE